MQQDLATASFSTGDLWVKVTIRGRPTGAPYRAELMRGLDLMGQHGVSGWLSDMTSARVMDPEDERWSLEAWLPRALSIGLKRIAFIQPANVFSRMQAQRWERDPATVWQTLPYEMRMFGDEEDAKQWLRGFEARNSVLPGF